MTASIINIKPAKNPIRKTVDGIEGVEIKCDEASGAWYEVESYDRNTTKPLELGPVPFRFVAAIVTQYPKSLYALPVALLLWTLSRMNKQQPFIVGIRAKQQMGIPDWAWKRVMKKFVTDGYAEIVEHRPGKPSLLLFHEKPNKG